MHVSRILSSLFMLSLEHDPDGLSGRYRTLATLAKLFAKNRCITPTCRLFELASKPSKPVVSVRLLIIRSQELHHGLAACGIFRDYFERYQ